MQQKDVIYIDVEDDITAIIGKVKGAKEKIVALVPPKRTGVLQSAVNLRLLAKAADSEKKRLVLITGNSALAGLAASAKIPVAKTLQSPPKLADVPEADDDDEDDVIDGKQLPVGDHAGMKKDDDDAEEIIVPADLDSIDVDNDAPTKPVKSDKQAAKKRVKVPDFGTFRKKLVLGISGGILLVLFLVWAIVIAPHATVVVSAKTSPVEVKKALTIGDSLSNDPTKNTLSSITQTDKVSTDVDIEPTGTKEVGEKATGTVVFSNCQDPSSLTINAGTYISNHGNNYVVQSTVVVPGGSGNFFTGCTSPGQSEPVKIVATDIGDKYNTAADAQFTVAGFTNKMTASTDDGITGGESHEATVVTADDVQKALDELKQKNTNDQKKKLAGKFSDGIKVINETFTSTSSEPKLAPGIGEEVKDGSKAKMTVEVTYTLMGVSKDALDDYLNTVIEDQLGGTNDKRIYDSGASKARFSEFQAATDDKPTTVRVEATGQVGPKIDDNRIKELVQGKRSGEVIGLIKAIDGVSDVDVKLSPFWVQGVPGDTKKITVEFKLINND